MKHISRNLLTVTVLGLAFGCEVGPEYKPPKTDMKAGYTEVGESVKSGGPSTRISEITTRPASVADWWTSFHDPELDSLIDRAVKGNLDVKQAESRIRQARYQRGMASSALFPTINADSGFQHARGSKNIHIPSGAFGGGSSSASSANSGASEIATPAAVSSSSSSASVGSSAQPGGPLSPLGLGGLPGVETDVYQAGFDATWEADVFGGTRRSIEAADAEYAAAIEDRRSVLVSLTAEVARSYIELRGFQRQENIARENLQTQEDTLAIVRDKNRVGLVSDLDVARQEAQVATTSATIFTVEMQIRQTIHGLGILLGSDPDILLMELTAEAPLPPVPPEVPIGLPSDLLRQRADIRQAERMIAAANARIGVATADLYPKFSITGQMGLDSSQPKQLFDWESRYFLFSPGISWPIFDAGRIKNNIEVQKELTLQARLTYEQTVLQALGDVENAIVDYRQEQYRRAALTNAVKSSRDAVDLAHEQYKKGVSDFLVVLEAQQSLLTAENSLAQSDQAVATNVVALYKALGGGWQTPDSPG